MEKIKSILNPGHKVDDEMLYGENHRNSPAARGIGGEAPVTGTHLNETEQSATLHSTSPPANNDNGVPRQILNPNNDKYDVTRYSTSASTDAPTGTHGTEAVSKDKDRSRQISPQDDRYDNTRFGRGDASAVLGTSTHPTSSTGRGSSTYPTSSTAPTSSNHPASTTVPQSTTTNPAGSSSEFGSATVFGTTTTGPTTRLADSETPGPTGTARDQYVGSTGAAGSNTHHHGNEAAIAGGVGAAGLGAYEASRHHDQKYTTPATQSSDTTAPIRQSTAQIRGPDAAVGTGSSLTAASALHRDRDISFTSGSSSIPRTSGPASIASNASIKSGIVGNAPTGSSLTKDSAKENLPIIPATGNKMADSSLASSAQAQSSDERAFPLTGGQTTASTTGSASTSNPLSNTHAGGNAALVGGAGLAGAGAYEAWKRHEQTESANTRSLPTQSGTTSSTTGENHGLAGALAATSSGHNHGGMGHEFRGDPCPPSGTQTGGTFNGHHATQTANRIDPNVTHDSISHMPGAYPRSDSDMVLPYNARSGNINPPDNVVSSQGTNSSDRHLGRDAAVAGGVGAAGLGAYETSKHLDNAYTGSTAQPQTSAGDTSGTALADSSRDTKNHTGRNAAIAGGVGAAGLGAYEANKHHDQTSSGSTIQSKATTGDSTRNPPTDASSRDTKDYTGRNVALAGGTGIAGLGAYEANRHHEHKQIGYENQPSNTVAASSTRTGLPGSTGTALGQTPGSKSFEDEDKSFHGRDATFAGGVGAAGVSAYEAKKHHDQKENIPTEKDTTDNNHHHHKGRDTAAVGAAGAAGAGVDHEYSKREAEKLAKERQKEADKRHKEHDHDIKRQEKEAAKAEKKHEKQVDKEEKKHHGGFLNKLLHRSKDKHAEEETASDSKHHKEEAALGAGAVGAGVAAHDGRNRLHKDPPTGLSHHNHTTGTGHQHIGTDGQIGDANKISGLTRTEAGEYGAVDLSEIEGNRTIVKDPHTGLPMNVGKYGDGHGGTDGSATVSGFHDAPTGGEGHQHTDWDAIKKANTPF